MGDDLDKVLDSYKVADAGAPLLERVVAAAQSQHANENATKAVWVRRTAMLVATAVLGFWMGNVTQPSTRISTAATSSYETTQASGSNQYYLDRMIMGPGSLNEIGL
ncbi:MAG: hypothetical protein ACAH83_06015 [Alphaproteobacteria bacterium]